MKYTVKDLLNMDKKGLREILFRGTPIDINQMSSSAYVGIDLSLPGWMNKLLWKKFRKAMYRDTVSDVIRGWNVRLVQNGIDGPSIPMRKSNGEEWAFGHFVLRSADGIRFPKGWEGGHYLDFRIPYAGNSTFDPARFGFCPIVAVNEGSVELFLGVEIFKVGPFFIDIHDFWLLHREGPLETVVPVPCPGRIIMGK